MLHFSNYLIQKCNLELCENELKFQNFAEKPQKIAMFSFSIFKLKSSLHLFRQHHLDFSDGRYYDTNPSVRRRKLQLETHIPHIR